MGMYSLQNLWKAKLMQWNTQWNFQINSSGILCIVYLIASSSVIVKRSLCWDTTSTVYLCKCFFSHSDANEDGSMRKGRSDVYKIANLN
jgi:hypothetical protein